MTKQNVEQINTMTKQTPNSNKDEESYYEIIDSEEET